MNQCNTKVNAPAGGEFALPMRATFSLGDRVYKKFGAAWQAQVVGWYCTKLTPEGYAVGSGLTLAQYKFSPCMRLNA